jgi:hypothetical protein
LQHALVSERLLGRISPGPERESNTIGQMGDLSGIISRYPVREIIFCAGTLLFREIIDTVSHIPPHIRIRIFIPGKHFMIGGGVIVVPGDLHRSKMNLHQRAQIRNKYFCDFLTALFLLVTFPIHIFVKKRPGAFFKNVFLVLLQKRTWIGYATPQPGLPALQPGILTTTGLPVALNTLGEARLQQSDYQYACNFSISMDLRLLWLNYQLLS